MIITDMTKIGDPQVLSCREDLFGSGHNAFFRAKSGDRRTVIGKVTFTQKNGEIYQTID